MSNAAKMPPHASIDPTPPPPPLPPATRRKFAASTVGSNLGYSGTASIVARSRASGDISAGKPSARIKVSSQVKPPSARGRKCRATATVTFNAWKPASASQRARRWR